MEECAAAGREFGSGSGSAQEMLGCLTIRPKLPESTTRTPDPDYHGSNVHNSRPVIRRKIVLQPGKGFSFARLCIFIDWNEPGGEWVEGRFGTVSCWFILWQQQLATLSDTFVFPRAINRGVVWFAINQSSHKYPTEAKTTKASWPPADDYISHASPDHLCQSLLIQRL